MPLAHARGSVLAIYSRRNLVITQPIDQIEVWPLGARFRFEERYTIPHPETLVGAHSHDCRISRRRDGIDMTTEEQQLYITMEDGWNPKICPFCKLRVAIGHGWLFEDPPPSSPLGSKRKAIGEVFMHSDSEDCVAITDLFR